MNTALLFLMSILVAFQCIYFEDLITKSPAVLSLFATAIGYLILTVPKWGQLAPVVRKTSRAEIIKTIFIYQFLIGILSILWIVLTQTASVYYVGLADVSYPLVVLAIYGWYQKKKVTSRQLVGALCVLSGILIATL